MKENNCPSCGKLTDTATAVEGDYTPSDGDISLCIYCGAINQFDSELNIVPMPLETLANIKYSEPETYDVILKTVGYIKNNVR